MGVQKQGQEPERGGAWAEDLIEKRGGGHAGLAVLAVIVAGAALAVLGVRSPMWAMIVLYGLGVFSAVYLLTLAGLAMVREWRLDRLLAGQISVQWFPPKDGAGRGAVVVHVGAYRMVYDLDTHRKGTIP